MEAYPNKTQHDDSRVVFNQLLDDGVEADDLIAEAEVVAINCIGKKPKDIAYLCYWLKVDALPSLEARVFKMGRADVEIVPKAVAGKIYQSHEEAAYGFES